MNLANYCTRLFYVIGQLSPQLSTFVISLAYLPKLSHVIKVYLFLQLTCSVMMIKLRIASYIGLLVAATSGCSALKTLSSPVNTNTAAPTQTNGNPNFLDNIAVTPGATNEPATAVKGSHAAPYANIPKRTAPINPTHGETNPVILKQKYAPIFEVSENRLTNTALLRNLDHWWGTQYILGGEDENGIDCSAFSQTMLRDVYSLNIPRNAQDQYDSTLRVDDNKLAEGDLVFFHTSGRGNSVTHVGVYITNNHFAHASTSGGVTVSTLDDPYWKVRYVGAGRVKGYGNTSAQVINH
jgi:lipoprotein Spr